MKDEGHQNFSEFAVQKINPINFLNLDKGIDIWHEINIRPRKCGKNDKLRINVGPRKFISIF